MRYVRGNVTKYRFATRKKFRRSPFSLPELFPEPIRSSPWPEGRFHHRFANHRPRVSSPNGQPHCARATRSRSCVIDQLVSQWQG